MDTVSDSVSGYGLSPEEMCRRAHRLTCAGERREAADLLRLAVSAAEDQNAEPHRMLPIVESLAEVLWQMNERREARLQANRAIALSLRSPTGRS